MPFVCIIYQDANPRELGAFMDNATTEIVEYLNGNCKGGDMGRVALTQFHFVVDEDGDAVPFIGKNGRLGLAELMEKLAEFWPQVVRNGDGQVIAAGRQLSAVSLDHGGQLVVSIVPLLTLAEVEAEYRNFLFRVEQILKPVDYKLVTCGFHPSAAVNKLEAVPFAPYQKMEEHMGADAAPLLLGAAHCRAAFEYADEDDAIRKMRIATMLGPVFAYMTSNTPVFDKEGNADSMLGLKLIRKAAPGVAGAVEGLFDEGFDFKTYAAWLLEHDLADEHGSQEREMILDVDLATGVELVQADPRPVEPMMGYLALLKGIFYSPVNLELLEMMLDYKARPVTKADIDAAVELVGSEGGAAKLWGKGVDEWVDLLFRMSSQALGTEAQYLEALQEYQAF